MVIGDIVIALLESATRRVLTEATRKGSLSLQVSHYTEISA